MPIGENSKNLIAERRKQRSEYEKSDEYKEWLKNVKKLNDKIHTMDPETFDAKWDSLYGKKPKKDFDDITFAIRYGSSGREYVDNYIRRGGKDLSMAYLKDLGYNEEVANMFIKKMIKSNRTLGVV